jgi:hypothetical protein
VSAGKKTFHCIKQGSLVYGKCTNKLSVMEIKFTPVPDLVREQKHIQSDRKSFKFFSYALAFSVTAMLPSRGRFQLMYKIIQVYKSVRFF